MLRLPPLPAWGVSRGCVLAPIGVDDATLGFLAILEPDGAAAPAEADLLAAQHAANVYALALMRERLTDEVTTELRDQLLEALLDGQVTDEVALHERARRLGYNEAVAYRVMVFSPDTQGTVGQPLAAESGWTAGWRRRLLDGVAQLVRERAPQAIITRRREKSINFGIAGLIVGVYYLLLLGSEALSLQGYLDPSFALWIPNIIFGTIGTLLAYRLCAY